MKPLKMLGLAVMMAAAFMAVTGSAVAAPHLTSPAGTEFTGEIHETLNGSWLIKIGPGNITCTTATRVWDITTNDELIAGGPITGPSYTNCGSATVDILSNGSLQVGSGGSVKQTGGEVTVSILGTSCVYGGGAGTTIGTLTGGSPAKMTEKAKLPKISGGVLCANPAEATGSYTITSPATLIID